MTENKAGAGTLATARAKLAEYITERERLPRAICAICGGVVQAGSGICDGEPSLSAQQTDGRRRRENLPPLHDWLRLHEACTDLPAVVLRLTGLRVSEAVAESAFRAVHPVIPIDEMGQRTSRRAPVFAVHAARLSPSVMWPGGAWKHVSKAARKDFAEVVLDAEYKYRVKTEPSRCEDGPCGACGVALSIGWHKSPIKWSDGSPAPRCTECAKVADRRPASTDIVRLRAVALEALSGASGMDMGWRFADHMRLFAELVEPGHPGTAERWAHAAERWSDVREAARLNYVSSLPTGMQEEYKARARAIGEELAAEQQTREETERREVDASSGWPT